MALAGVLEKYGYNPLLIDAKMRDDYLEYILANAEHAICLGVSVIIGYQIKDGLYVTDEVKKRFPKLPVVWGGWHPTMATEQTLSDPRVDIVVRGQGEITFLELVSRLSKGQSLEGLHGISYKKEDGTIVHNHSRLAADPNLLPPLPYHLIDPEQYLSAAFENERVISYFTSYGCPYHCTFCSNVDVFGPRWYALKADRVVADYETLVNKYGARHIILDDANYFTNKQRALEIAKLTIDKGLEGKFTWDATGTANVVSSFDHEELELLRRSGCAIVFIGAETGDHELMQTFQKPINNEQIEKAVAGLGTVGIIPIVSFVVGVPGEPAGALDNTLRLASRLFTVHPRPEVRVFFFEPIPHTALSETPTVVQAFSSPPTNMEGWIKIADHMGYAKSEFDVPKSYTKKVDRFRQYTAVMWVFPRKPENSISYKMLRKIASFRLRHLWFDFPIELKAVKAQVAISRKLSRPKASDPSKPHRSAYARDLKQEIEAPEIKNAA